MRSLKCIENGIIIVDNTDKFMFFADISGKRLELVYV